MTTVRNTIASGITISAILAFSIVASYQTQNAFAESASLVIMCNSTEASLVFLVNGFPANTQMHGIIVPAYLDEEGNLVGSVVNGFIRTTNIYGSFRMDRAAETLPAGWTVTLDALFFVDSNSNGIFDSSDLSVQSQNVNYECPTYSAAQQAGNLVNLVYSIALSQKATSDLQKPLLQAQKVLTDSTGGNDSNACGKLTSFNGKVKFYENKGQLTPAQADELRHFAGVMSASIGC